MYLSFINNLTKIIIILIYVHPLTKQCSKTILVTMIIGTHLCEPSIGSSSGHHCNNFKCGPLDISIEWNGMEQCLL
jgi:hypothetical protein